MAAFLFALSGCGVSTPPTSHAVPSSPTGWKTLWADDFTGSAGSEVDHRWVHDIGGDGWGNSELQFYTADVSNASLDGRGDLAITALRSTSKLTCWYGPCGFTSARLSTLGTFSVRYGRIEARAKLPSGSGLWSAFWMLGLANSPDTWPRNGEIDVMENIGSSPRAVYGSMHGPGYSGSNDLTSSYTLSSGPSFSAGFHTFAVDWSPTSVSYFVDGQLYETQTPNTTRGAPWVFTHPFSLILNLAVGGSWPGTPTAQTVFPATMLVDYVAVYQKG